MKIIIFAGGVGTRLWPLSRKNTPKQFEKIIGDNSTLQQTVVRLRPDFAYEDMYIATGLRYKDTVLEQLPEIPRENFIFEPEMRDVGPAIGLASFILSKKFPDTPVAILWSDHMVKHIDSFKYALHLAETMIVENGAKFVYVGQKPRFANQNMGWIELGNQIKEKNDKGVMLYEFKKLRYRPKLEEATKFFHDSNFVWNLGYFVTTPQHIVELFSEFAPAMSEQLEQLKHAWGTDLFEEKVKTIYPTLEKISFDDLILVNMDSKDCYVVASDLGWSDVGAWESLKEALSQSVDENVTKGNVVLEDSRDVLAFNYNNQLVVGIDLDEMLVINTADVVLVCPKTSVPKIKKLVESFVGTQYEHLT